MKTIFTGEAIKAPRPITICFCLLLLVSCRPHEPAPAKSARPIAELKSWQIEALDQEKLVWNFHAAEAKQETWGLILKQTQWQSSSWQFKIPEAQQKSVQPQIIWLDRFSGFSSDIRVQAENGRVDLKDKVLSGQSLEMSGTQWTLSAQKFSSTKDLDTWVLRGVKAKFNVTP